MGILSFRATTIVPAALRGEGAGFVAGGQFIVRVSFDPEDCARYQYRQYIKGTAFLTQGMFGPGAPSRTNWLPTGVPHDAKADFEVPGGLQTHFTEDGQTHDGRTERFGYRTSHAVLRSGLEDRYLPAQLTGPEYRLRDTWGLRGTSRPRGLKVKIDIVYQGAVIDTLDGGRHVATRHWGVHIDDIVA